MTIELAKAVLKKYGTLKGERTNWDAHWDEVAKYVIPRKDNVYGHAQAGEKRSNRLFDTEAIRAADELAAALHGMLTNPAAIWFGLSTGDRQIDLNEKVQKWLHKSSLTMINVLNQSNFQQEILETYTDLASIGTNTLRIEEDDEEVVKFHSSPVYAVYIDENSKGDIDTVLRCYKYTRRQILQEFGDTMSPEAKLMMIEESDAFKKWEIVHEVSPREDHEREENAVGNKAFKYKSTHVLSDKSIVLEDGGFEEFPYAVPRWSKINKEKYGRSPAMKVLADIKMMNTMKKVVIQGAQLAIAPPLQVPDAGFLAPLKLSPYATNYRRSGLGEKVEPLFTGADPRIGFDLMEAVKQSIRQAFFLDKLNVSLGDRATATEVMQRKDEQLRTLGPILGRLNRELLQKIIDRVFGIMERKGLFDEPPAEIKKGDSLSIKYVSAISQAQIITESENMTRALNAAGPLLQFIPDIIDNIDGDKYLRQNWEIFGNDPAILKSEIDRDKQRDARAKAQQAEAEAERAKTGAEVISKVGGTNGTGGAGQ